MKQYVYFDKTVCERAYTQELNKIMSLTPGETFDVDNYYSKICLSKDYLMGRDQAIESAIDKGYIESISIYFDLYGNQTKEQFRRL